MTTPLDTDTLISSVLDRVTALLTVCSTTAALAFAELKLAAASAVVLLGTGILLVFMLFTGWAMILVSAFFALTHWGIGSLGAMGILLLAQFVVCALLGLFIKHLLEQTRFTNTRRAMQELQTHPEPSTEVTERKKP